MVSVLLQSKISGLAIRALKKKNAVAHLCCTSQEEFDLTVTC
jgi:hypothetical protein